MVEVTKEETEDKKKPEDKDIKQDDKKVEIEDWVLKECLEGRR